MDTNVLPAQDLRNDIRGVIHNPKWDSHIPEWDSENAGKFLSE